MGENVSCKDFMEFQQCLKSMRTIDDKIIYQLNTTIPTNSFAQGVDHKERCKSLYNQLDAAYTGRRRTIRHCIDEVSQSVESLRALYQKDEDNSTLFKQLRSEQGKLRLMQNELNVEHVIQKNSLKVFHERCRHFFSVPGLEA